MAENTKTNKSEEKPKTDARAQVEEKAKVSIDADKLGRILNANEDMARRLGQLESNASLNSNTPTMRTKGTKEKLVKLRRWNGDLVIGWKNMGTEKKPLYIVSEYDKERRMNVEYRFVLLKNNPEKAIKVENLVFLQESETVLCKETGLEKKEIVTTHGSVFKKDFVQNGYGMFETQVEVPLEVVEHELFHTVVLEDGEEFTISGRFVG